MKKILIFLTNQATMGDSDERNGTPCRRFSSAGNTWAAATICGPPNKVASSLK